MAIVQKQFVPALYTGDRFTTGVNHGDAYSKLSNSEKENPLHSGFVDNKNLKFVSDSCEFYIKEIIVIRHAVSDGQDIDSHLTEEGRNQAEKVAIFLFKMNIKDFKIFTSPYKRCVETTSIINSNFEVDSRLSKGEDERVKLLLDDLPSKSLLISHCDVIQNLLMLACHVMLESIPNCSITYVNHNRIIWLAKEL